MMEIDYGWISVGRENWATPQDWVRPVGWKSKGEVEEVDLRRVEEEMVRMREEEIRRKEEGEREREEEREREKEEKEKEVMVPDA